jgi:hypothetical protein
MSLIHTATEPDMVIAVLGLGPTFIAKMVVMFSKNEQHREQAKWVLSRPSRSLAYFIAAQARIRKRKR